LIDCIDCAACVMQNNVYSRKEQMEQCRAQMKWNQQALEAWLEEAARKDEDGLIVKRYAVIDKANIKVT